MTHDVPVSFSNPQSHMVNAMVCTCLIGSDPSVLLTNNLTFSLLCRKIFFDVTTFSTAMIDLGCAQVDSRRPLLPCSAIAQFFMVLLWLIDTSIIGSESMYGVCDTSAG